MISFAFGALCAYLVIVGDTVTKVFLAILTQPVHPNGIFSPLEAFLCLHIFLGAIP